MDSFKCEVFLTAVDLGSLSDAADFLGYTQPGITRIIKSLEDEVGFPLLVRMKKGVVLTENGRTMMPLFRSLVSAGKNAIEMSGEICGLTSGTLVIGSYYSVSAMLLPGILKVFQSRYPNIRIRLKEGGNSDLARWLSHKSVDCTFAIKPSKNIECDWIPIYQDELTVWLPQSHSMADKKKYPVAQLGDEHFISTMPGQDTEIDRFLKRKGITPNMTFSTADAYAAYKMVEAGLGVSINNRLFTKDWNGNVSILPLSPPEKIMLGISVPSLREASPATRKFIECVKELYQ